MGTKNLFAVTMPATVTVVAEGSDADEATASAIKTIKAVLSQSLGVLSVIGDAKVTAITVGKSKAKVKDDDDEEETDEEEEEEEEEEEPAPKKKSKAKDDDEEEEDEEEEEEEEEEEKPAPKKKSKDAGDSGGKKKIKIKLKG